DALRLLDHALGVYRPAVVDDEADAEGRTVLPDPPPEVFRAHGQRQGAGARRGGTQGRVDSDVVVARPRQAMPRVFPAPTADEGARAPAEPCSLQTVAPPRAGEDGGWVDAHRLDRRDGVRPALELGPYLARPAAFFGVTSTSSASSSSRRSTCGSALGAGPKGSAGSRCPSASSAAASTSSAVARSRPSSAASAFAHSTIVMSARWLSTPERTTTCATAA